MADFLSSLTLRTGQGRLRVAQLLCAAVSFAALHSMSRGVLAWMAFVFREPREDMAHGWIVPLFSIALLWYRRRELSRAVGAPSWKGALCVAAGLFLFWVGARGDQVRITQIALFWTLWSLSYALCGWNFARLTLFPAAFLLFTVPLSFLDIFTVKLRFLTSAIAAAFLNGVAIPVVRTGTGLHCLAGEGFNLDVADPCSGLRSIFALSALTAAYAYVTQRTLLRKWILFVCAVPVAILGNLVRIVSIAVVAKFCGQEVATGFYHDYSGYVVFVVGILAIMQIAAWLQRGKAAPSALSEAAPGTSPAPARFPQAALPALLSAIMICATGFYLRALPPPAEEPADFIVAVLPPLPSYRPMYPWYCQNEHCGQIAETEAPFDRPDACPKCGSPMADVSIGERTLLPSDTGFRKCNYYDAMGDVYRVTVVINGKSRQSIHRPEVCLPAQGFSMENSHVEDFDLGGGERLAVRCVDLRRRDSASPHRMGQGYYFVSAGSRVASHLARMLISVRDRAFRNRITRWAMVTLFCEDSLSATPGRRREVSAFLAEFHAALLASGKAPATPPPEAASPALAPAGERSAD